MELKRQLVNLLADLPINIRNSNEREAFLLYYNLQDLASRINLEGDTQTFCVRLIGTIASVKDRETLLNLLEDLANRDDIGFDAQQKLNELKQKIANLKQKQWNQFKSYDFSLEKDLNKQELRQLKLLHSRAIEQWISYLDGSLKYEGGDIPNLDIQLQELPNAVMKPTGIDGVFLKPQQISSKELTNVFKEMGAGRSLLILGYPGSGKTTILLGLLKELIDNFGEDWSKPVPVVLNLSSWKARQENFAIWLVEELNRTYNISKIIAKSLIDKERLILLLDGLDEINAAVRRECIQKLNDFIMDGHGGTEIVVCSRLQEYEEILGCSLLQEDEERPCDEGLKLRLQKAFYLQPLTSEKIDEYLGIVQKSVEPLKTLFREADAQLRNPLVLYVIRTADIEVQNLPQTKSLDEIWNYLWEKYSEFMFKRKQKEFQNKYPKFSKNKKKTREWLQWLAKKMKENGSIFQIERMQPNWLTSEKDKFVYRIATGLIVGSILGLIAGFYFIYYCELMRQDKSITIAITNALGLKLITIGLLSGLISGLIAGLLPTSSNRFIRGGLSGITFALFIFLVFNSLEPQLLRVYMPPIYLAGIFGGACFSLIRAEIQPAEIWQPEWQEIVKFSLIFGAFGILYMLARRFFIMPEFYKEKPFYVIYDVIAIMIVGAVYGGFRINNPGDPPKEGKPNQGIKRSAKYTVISFTTCTMIGILCAYIFDPVKNLVLIFLGLAVGLLGGLGANQGSGIVCIQHFILRVILWYRGYIPWNYARFLNYATERVFLRKSGGAYLFFHGKLMDYFDEMELNSVQPQEGNLS